MKPPTTPTPNPSRRARASERFTRTSSGDRDLGLLYECAGMDGFRKEGGDGLRQGPNLVHDEAGRPPGPRTGRNQSAREAMARRLREAAFRLTHATHLARQTEL